MTIADLTWSLLDQALEAYADSPRATQWLRRQKARFGEPVRLVVAGPRGSGRSTLINAIAGEEIVRSDARGPAWYHIPATRSQPELTLVDAPPIEETGPAENVCMEADGVLYLIGHPHNADLSFPRTLADHPVAREAPVNSLIVLSRADELGGGRVDSVVSARQVARRYRKNAEFTGLCQDIVAVAGLVASAARTMRDSEFDMLAALASVPKVELEPLLLSAERFMGEPAREQLLARFGLFGIRLATTLLRGGADSRQALASQLVKRCGLSELKESITANFTERADVLKARSALIGLEVVLRMEPRPAAGALVAGLERTLANAHEFQELRLLAALRTGRASLPPELREEALRLIGGYGTSMAARLGVDADEAALRDTAIRALRLWQEYAENPVLGAAERRAASVVVRSCEAMSTGAAAGGR
ncbi:GTPase domain-containing protein [Saccharomonospora sp. NPDC006951]